MVERYHALREQYYGRYTYDISEETLLRLGRQYLRREMTDEALTVFKLNLEFSPGSAATFDGMGDVYAARGDRELAIAFYQQALVHAPDNRRVAEKLRELNGA